MSDITLSKLSDFCQDEIIRLFSDKKALSDTSLNFLPFGKTDFIKLMDESEGCMALIADSETIRGLLILKIIFKDRKALADIVTDTEKAEDKAEFIRDISDTVFNLWGLTKITFRIPESSDELIRNLESRGFAKEAVLRKSVLKNGEFADMAVMSLISDKR